MCFSLPYIENLLIWLVIICALVAFARLLLPKILSLVGVAGDIVMQAINIFVWAVVCIFVIIFVFDLIGCLIGMGGGGHFLPRWR